MIYSICITTDGMGYKRKRKGNPGFENMNSLQIMFKLYYFSFEKEINAKQNPMSLKTLLVSPIPPTPFPPIIFCVSIALNL